MSSFYDNHLNWGLDPLFHAHVKMLVGMLHRLTQPKSHKTKAVAFYRYAPHQPARPLRLVHISGIVVFLARHTKFSRYLVDDGSATARCVLWNDDAEHSPVISLGDFVSVLGRIEWQQGVLLVIVNTQHVPSWPYAELSWWLEVKDVHQKVYSEPLVINLVSESSLTS
ncbi:unnamed protein product [Agarophyton chilense]